MQVRNVPPVNARYWTAIIAASMCGANMGDFFSEYLHLGNAAGVLPLLILFLAVLWLERRSTRPTEAYYWLAIIVLRTVATNLADFATHDLRLGYPVIESGLALILVVLVSVERLWRRGEPRAADTGGIQGVPITDAAYWAAMLTAGTLGTASGDFVQGHAGFGLGSGPASIATGIAFLIVLFLALRIGRMAKSWYWASIVVARTAGTDMGDFLAGKHGLHLGLPISLTCTALLLAGIVVLWHGPPPVLQAVAPGAE
jgi:uncharacterized membrane-anchored protein